MGAAVEPPPPPRQACHSLPFANPLSQVSVACLTFSPRRYDPGLMPPSLPRVAMLLLLATIAGCGNEPLPSSEWHRMNGGKLQSKGDYAGAIAEYDRAIARSPNNAYAYHDRGVAKRKAGDTAGAVADFDDGVQLDPNYGSLYFNRAYTKAPNVAAGSTPADLAGI